MALDWNRIIEQALATATVIVPAVIGGMIKLRRLEQNQGIALENQNRIEAKSDGQHAKALDAVKETSRENVEQLLRAVEVLAAQSRRAARRSTDDLGSTPKRGRRSTDPKEPSK